MKKTIFLILVLMVFGVVAQTDVTQQYAGTPGIDEVLGFIALTGILFLFF